MTEFKVSVCISVHNTATLLPRCLDSVCSQTLKDLEIVLVNNGSTDNSEEIMRAYSKNHPERRFVIVAQEDRGLAQGRQSGVDNASGKYITFLDADDYVVPTAYEEMYECALTNGVDIVSIDTLRGEELVQDPLEGVQKSYDVLLRYLLQKDINPMIWMRLYKRSLFNRPVFPTIYMNNEDVFAFPCLLYSSENICFFHKALHHYSIDNEESYMNVMKNNPSNKIKNYERTLRARLCIPFMKEYMKSYEDDKELANALRDYECHSIIFSIMNNISGYSFAKKSRDISDLLGFSDTKEMFLFVQKHVIPNTAIKKLVKRFGLPIAYRLLLIKKIVHL